MALSYQKQWQFLKKTVELGKIPHALLFYGQNLTEKMSAALDFVKLINCQDERCRQDIEKNVHPDLFIIEPQDKEITIAVQINGKVRAEILIQVDDNEEEVKKKALANQAVLKYLAGNDSKKIIYVKNRVINILG